MFYLYQLLSVPVLVGLAWSFWTALHLHPLNSIDLDSTLMDHVPLNWGILQISPPFRSKGRCKGLGASGSSRAALLARSWVRVMAKIIRLWVGIKKLENPDGLQIRPFFLLAELPCLFIFAPWNRPVSGSMSGNNFWYSLIWTWLLEQIYILSYRSVASIPTDGIQCFISAKEPSKSMGNSLPARGEVTASRGSLHVSKSVVQKQTTGLNLQKMVLTHQHGT